ncbi:hypothetical protein LCGC14_1753590, partial [marine sediment metagenome]
MEDVLSVAKMINEMIAGIGMERRRLDDLARHKARTESDYQRTVTTTMAALR